MHAYQMTKNSQGHWQTRENAALAAAGLNSDTSTHSCSAPSVYACALTGTIAGEGENAISEIAGDLTETLEYASEITDKIKP